MDLAHEFQSARLDLQAEPVQRRGLLAQVVVQRTPVEDRLLEHGGVQVDRQAETGQWRPRLVPLPVLEDHPLHHPAVQANHLVQLRGHGQDIAGVEQPQARVLPAHQRLQAEAPATGQIDLGLVDEVEVLARRQEGLLKLTQEDRPLLQATPQPRFEELMVPRSGADGAPQGRLRLLHQGDVILGIIGIAGDSDRGSEQLHPARQVKGGIHGLLKSQRRGLQALGRHRVLDQHPPAGLAEPGHGIFLAEGLPDAPGHLTNQLRLHCPLGRRPKRIELDKQQGEALIESIRALHGMAETILEETLAGRAGQGVLLRGTRQLVASHQGQQPHRGIITAAHGQQQVTHRPLLDF